MHMAERREQLAPGIKVNTVQDLLCNVLLAIHGRAAYFDSALLCGSNIYVCEPKFHLV